MRKLQLTILGIAAALAASAQTGKEATEPKPTAPVVSRLGESAQLPVISKVIRSAPRTAAASERAAADPTLTSFEVVKTFTVAAGQTVGMKSNSDWTGGSEVSISINCASVANIRVYALWTVPIADFFTGTDIIAADKFAFTNQGGGIVPVHGTQLQVQVRNTGTADVSCDQLVVYGTVR
jgi:hypothetical protein